MWAGRAAKGVKDNAAWQIQGCWGERLMEGAESTQCPEKVSVPVCPPLPLTVYLSSPSLPQPLLFSLSPCWVLGLHTKHTDLRLCRVSLY